MNILVLDVGTSSMRGTLLDETASIRFQNHIKYSPTFLEGGAVVQAPADWLDAVKALCAEAKKTAPVDAVALTAQRSSVIPADGNGDPLANAIMWQDTRNRAVCDGFHANEETIRSICGTGVNTVYSGGKMAWLRREYPDVYARTEHLFVIPDYLIFQLTGNHVTDHTYGSRSMLMDLRKREWSQELLDLFGLEQAKLGRLIAPASIAGTVTERFAGETGLTTGIPVITCGGDQQCGALGQGVYKPGHVSVNLGTGAYLIAPVQDVPDDLDPGLICNASAVPGQYILEASVLTCGAALDWFLREFGGNVEWVGQALKNSPPGANSVTALPYFQGRANPDWNSEARAAFFGFSLATNKYDMLRALLESICIEISRSLGQVANGTPIREIRLSGGLSRTSALCQLLANVTGVQVICADDGDATTKGGWMSAAKCLGLKDSWDAAWAQVRPALERTYIPRNEQKRLYDSLSEKMEQLYQASFLK